MHKGFTLIETLVAISVLVMALVGPLTIAEQSLRSAYYSRDQITAFYLAQEGIEYVRAIRDQNYLEGRSWLTGVSNCTNTNCTIDFPNFVHSACTNNVCTPLLVSANASLFNTVSGVPSKFTRSVSLIPVSGQPNQMIIKVTVSWASGNIQRSFNLEERIFDWL